MNWSHTSLSRRSMNDRLRISSIALEPVERCPLCDAAERTLFERAANPPEQIHLMRCGPCGFIYTSAVVPTGDVARVYEAYNAARDAESAQLRDQRLQMYAIDGAFARRYLRPGDARLLDVGSGTGDFVAQFAGALGMRPGSSCFAALCGAGGDTAEHRLRRHCLPRHAAIHAGFARRGGLVFGAASLGRASVHSRHAERGIHPRADATRTVGPRQQSGASVLVHAPPSAAAIRRRLSSLSLRSSLSRHAV